MRGTAAGEPIVSQARTREFDEGYDRTFGDHPPIRGKWVMTPHGLVPADEYVPESRALDAPVMVGRFYENMTAQDGTDISTRARHRAYMREKGLTTIDDYKGEWAKAQEKRAEIAQGKMPSKTRREAIARKMYEIDKP